MKSFRHSSVYVSVYVTFASHATVSTARWASIGVSGSRLAIGGANMIRQSNAADLKVSTARTGVVAATSSEVLLWGDY